MSENPNQRTAIIVFAITAIVLPVFLLLFSSVQTNRSRLEAYRDMAAMAEQTYQITQTFVNERYESTCAQESDSLAAPAIAKDLLKSQADSLVQFIEQLRNELISHVEGGTLLPTEGRRNIPISEISHGDDFSYTTRYMLGSTLEGSDPNCPAQQLKLRMQQFYASATGLIDDPAVRFQIQRRFEGLSCPDMRDSRTNEMLRWEILHFDHLELFAVISKMDQWATQVRLLEISVRECLNVTFSEDTNPNPETI